MARPEAMSMRSTERLRGALGEMLCARALEERVPLRMLAGALTTARARVRALL